MGSVIAAVAPSGQWKVGGRFFFWGDEEFSIKCLEKSIDSRFFVEWLKLKEVEGWSFWEWRSICKTEALF